MSYQTQDQLASDPPFQARVRACSVQQAEQTYVGSSSPADAAYARAIIRGTGPEQLTMFALAAQSPGLADEADAGDGTIDSSRITDPAILASVQAFWTDASSSWYSSDGSPLT